MIRFVFSLFLFSTFVSAQIEHTLDSRVVEATIFRDRALVKRLAKVELSKGKHQLLFSKLTNDLQDKSVRIEASGSGMVKILDVKVERRFTAELQQEKLKNLEKKLESLTAQHRTVSDKIQVLTNKKQFVESLQAESAKIYNQKMLLSPSSVKEWDTMLNFIDQRLTKIFTDLRKEETHKKQIEKDIRVVQSEINQSRDMSSRNYKEIIALIETETAGSVNVSPTYLVNNATWYPMYDVRVSSDAKQLELSYFGMVQQSTGEDWKNIDLTLSTTSPMIVQKLPSLNQWFVNTKPIPLPPRANEVYDAPPSAYNITYEQNYGLPQGTGALTGFVIDASSGESLPGVNLAIRNTKLGTVSDKEGKFYLQNIPAGSYTLEVNYIGFNTISTRLPILNKKISMLNIPMYESALELDEVIAVTADKPMIRKDMAASQEQFAPARKEKRPEYSTALAGELSTIFKLPAKNTIASASSPQKVTIAIESFPVDFEYTAIPKIIPKVYLKGKVLNNKTYPLLEGELNIFVDNEYINRSFINTIVASDSFEVALGTDDKINVERILINKFTESGGFLSGKSQVTYSYEIRLKNNRVSSEVINLFDQVPISMNEDIKIELISPDLDLEKLNSEKKLEWKIKLNSGEEKKIPLKFKIIYPSNVKIYGLE
jgi:hypothetical protein